MADAPKPLKVDDLTADELADLEAAGRIADGFVVPLPKPAAITPQQATTLDPKLIPELPEGVRERLAKSEQLKSSFVFNDPATGAEVRSDDGGKKAEEASQKQLEMDNEDWAGKPKEEPVDAADKLRFTAHILGAKHFSKTYALFGDKLLVTFRTRAAKEEAVAANQAWEDDKIDDTPANSHEAGLVRANRVLGYQFTMSLTRMEVAGDIARDFDYTKSPGNPRARVGSVRAAQDLLHSTLPGPLLVAMRNCHMKFENLVARMTLAASDESFWKADSAT